MASLSDVLEQIDAYVARQMRADNTPGLALAVTDRERLLRVATYGYADVAAQRPVTPETLFEIGSIGKSFTSIALLGLREAGQLDLQAPVTAYLPWFEVRSNYDPITVHHLLSHTAGIISGAEFSTDGRGAVWGLRETAAAAPPGSTFHYSNDGYKALGLMLERVAGQRYGAIIESAILEPLGMSATSPVITHETRKRLAVGYQSFYDDRPPRPEHPLVPATWLETNTGDGCLASTPADMAAYLRMLLNRGEGPRGPILSEESFALLTQRVIEMSGGGSTPGFYGYGLASRDVDGHHYLGHTGGMVGYFASMLGDMDDGVGVVVLVNGPGRPYGISRTVLGMLRAARQGEEIALPSVDDQMVVENAGDYVGTYQSSEKSFTVTAEGDRLFLEHNGERVPLELQDDDTFVVDHPDFALFLLHFGRAEDVVVEAFHGPDWYVSDRYDGPVAWEYPWSWNAYPGHYRSFNPWISNFRVILRKGRLWLIFPDGVDGFDDGQVLVPLGDGRFRVGEDEHGPERLRFDMFLNGEPLRANLSGCDFYRFFTP